MQKGLIHKEEMEQLACVSFLIGTREGLVMNSVPKVSAPFNESVTEFLSELSNLLLSDREAREFPDVVTFAFWIRKSAIFALKERFLKRDHKVRMGRGVAFHIAPSNVPMNYAYSMVAGLLTGNMNIVRIPGRNFPQAEIVNRLLGRALKKYPYIQEYLYLVRYGHNRQVNDIFSGIADIRIIWGGDNTIAELRKSPLKPRAGEITFADRYSLAVINSEKYLSLKNKQIFAESFYNDTYRMDQNACTSPAIVVWTGSRIAEAKTEFWDRLHKLVVTKYELQPMMAVNKLASSYLAAAMGMSGKIVNSGDNFIVRLQVSDLNQLLLRVRDHAGYFYEYECGELMEIRALCDDVHCQTIGFLGEREDLLPLLTSGIRGVDRVVPIGRTMDFDLIWDGYDLYSSLTRIIDIKI